MPRDIKSVNRHFMKGKRADVIVTSANTCLDSADFNKTEGLIQPELVQETLFEGVITKDVNKIMQALHSGADVNKTWYDTPLLRYAAQTGNDKIMQLLLLQGIDLKSDKEALMTAIEWENASVAAALIQNGFDMGYVDEKGASAMSLAASDEKMFDVLQLLLSKGASITPLNGVSVLGEAAASNNYKAVQELLSHYDSPDEKEQINPYFLNATPLARATEANAFPAVVKALIKAGADVNYRYDAYGENGGTPLINATCRVNVGAMRLLIEAGADVNKQNAFGYTPLMVLVRLGGAVSANMMAAASLLLMSGADLSLKDKQGKTVYYHLKKSLLPLAERRHLLYLFERAQKIENKPQAEKIVPDVKEWADLSARDQNEIRCLILKKLSENERC